MSNFDQAQDDLTKFLDDQFSNQSAEEEVPSQSNTDEDISEFLQGDEPQGAVDVQSPQPSQPQVPQLPSEADRILQLERELAATQTRSQMYENALQQQFYQQQQQPAQEFRTPNVVFDDNEIAIEERYETDYGDANPYIASIAKRVANDLYQRTVLPLQQELNNVRGQLQSQAEFNASQHKNTLHMQLKTVVPDIDDIVHTQEWQSYIKQPDLYGSGRTIASYVQEGIQYGNVRQLAQIVDQFKQTRQKSQPQHQQVAPGRAQANVPNTAPRGGRMLRLSEFNRATAEFKAGRLSWDRYQVVANEFNEAMLEGRVIHNK